MGALASIEEYDMCRFKTECDVEPSFDFCLGPNDNTSHVEVCVFCAVYMVAEDGITVDEFKPLHNTPIGHALNQITSA